MNDSILLPSAYCGNVEYFYYLWKYQSAVIDIHEKYKKQTFRNRCTILSANGPLNLSIPVERPNGRESLVHEVLLSQSENWQKDHFNAIESAYRRTPYFEYYVDQFHSILFDSHLRLIDLNNALNEFFISKIGLTIKTSFSEDHAPFQTGDLRAILAPKLDTGFQTKRYIQNFEERFGFTPNLSILDLLFHEGPNSISILQESGY